MAQSIYELVTNCTVRINVGNSKGTGFFVAPGTILTCAHVITPAQTSGIPIQIAWQGQSYTGTFQNDWVAIGPDLALLKVDISHHPCVLLAGSADPFSDLFSYGFPDTEPTGTPTTFKCVGWLGPQYEFVKFKEGQVRPGMSGSPILNNETGSVCGIVQITLDRTSAAGGKGLLTKVIYQTFPALEEAQKQFHTGDKHWSDALTQSQRERLSLTWLPAPTITGKIQVFFSYSHKDDDLKDDLDTALVMMRREGLIENWYDRDIEAGTAIDEEIEKHLNDAHIILLLVSPAFLRSDYCYQTEMTSAMKRHETKTARVVPI
ncbi:MAG TPA: trypsin-like peptidase domain-containing protein, partial [Ktedonobacteraceae bacterium]|nr:trypsin-like peptidase domain-containing protein [Ktedonobacteraceae bacterium]